MTMPGDTPIPFITNVFLGSSVIKSIISCPAFQPNLNPIRTLSGLAEFGLHQTGECLDRLPGICPLGVKGQTAALGTAQG